MINRLIMRIRKTKSGQKGQGLLEYVLIIGVIAMILITLVGSIGKKAYEFIAAAIQDIT